MKTAVGGDYHEGQARAVAAAQGGGKAKAVFVDARDVDTGIPPAGAAPQRSSAAWAGPVSTSSSCAIRRALRMPQSS